MFTASMLAEKLKEVNLCDGIDEWIQTDLLHAICESTTGVAVIDSSKIHSKGWSQSRFITSMQSRGFHVEFNCDDRPCALPYYVIKIPGYGITKR